MQQETPIMNNTVHEVLEFVKENDVKFIRLSFCDFFGFQKNIAIMASELRTVFENGVSFDANAVASFHDVTQSDLLLFPDPATLTVLPWRPGSGRVARFYCDIKNSDGSAFSHDSRILLKRVVQRAEKMGYACKIGVECEFYLFKTGDDGEPISVTLDKGSYFDLSPLDKGEDIRRELCLSLEEMGLKPEYSHHEQGPGQNEIVFKFSDALSCANNLQTFKSTVKAIAARNGLFASFMPKPILTEPGNGLHINLSITEKEKNILSNTFIAGMLAKTPEITLFLNPLANSYERFGKFEAPQHVSWSHQNRSQLVKIPAVIDEKHRVELRSPDPSINPYLAFALIISAGLDGIESKMALPPENATLAKLPESLENAIALAEQSDFVKKAIGKEFFSKYISFKKEEAANFAAAKDKAEFYKEQYFNLI
jgi:glutamine synthetase